MTRGSCPRAALRIAKAALAVSCFCLVTAGQAGQGPPGTIGGRVALAAGDAQKARELFRQGSVFFDSGQFGKAVEAWQRAYEEKQDPGLLYNIGQACRLAGDPRKALFFYRSFLRKNPRSAREREDAEQKIAALQAQIAAEDPQKGQAGAAATAAAPATAGEANTPPSLAPPPATASNGAAPSSETMASAGSTQPAVAPIAAPSIGAAPELRETTPAAELQPARVTPNAGGAAGARDEMREPTAPIDFGLAPGLTAWLAGPASGHRSAFAAAALLGYTFGDDDHDARVRLRVGAFLQYASLREPNGTDTFLDVLIAPTLRVRAWQQRLFVSLDLGMGVLVLAGLKPSSDFLAHNQAAVPTDGTQSMFELRPGATVSYRLYPAVELVAGPALAWNPKKAHFHEPMLRLQLAAGVALRF